jgi:UDP-glucose 4-epimerase
MADSMDPLTLAGKRVLVTGGAGFVGSHLVERLASELPDALIAVDNLFLGRDGNLDEARSLYPALKLITQDAADYDEMGAIMATERIDVVYNLAIVPLPASLVNPRWTVEHNVALTTVQCELQRQGYFATLIHFSSSEAYGSAAFVPMDESHPLAPSTPYAASKAASDAIVLSYRETYGSDVAIVRPFNNFGPRQNSGAYAGIIPVVLGRALRREPITVYGDGEQTRDFVYVQDTADAAVRVYQQPQTRGHILNIGSGQEVSVNRLVRELLDVLEVDVPVIHEAGRPGDVRRHCASIDKAADMIGFRPTTDLRSGLEQTAAWFRTLDKPPG